MPVPVAERKRRPSRRAVLAHQLALFAVRPMIRTRPVPAIGPPQVTFLLMSAYGMSGITRTVLTLAGHLGARHDVEVVSLVQRHDLPFFALPSGIRVTALDDQRPYSRRGLGHRIVGRFKSRLVYPGDIGARRVTLWTDIMLVRRLRRVRSGVVVGTRPSLNIVGSHLVRPGVVVVGQEHMHLARRDAAKQAAIRRTHRALDAVVVLTEADRREYEGALGGATRIDCIPNAAPEISGPPSDVSRPAVLAAGRLTPQKGFDRLISAFEKVARQEPKWTLRICGRGPKRAELLALVAELGVAGNVTLPGAVTNMEREMEQASIFVLSSRWEGFPMVLIEAMSKGLPVVSFDCPTGPADIIDHGRTGLLVPDGDGTALVDAVLELIHDEPKRRRFSAAAIQRADQFSLPRVGALWEALLADLVGASLPP